MALTRTAAAEQVLDTRTATQLGQALFTFLARAGEEPEMDDFSIEDRGVDIRSGFIEWPSDLHWTLGSLLERVDELAGPPTDPTD